MIRRNHEGSVRGRAPATPPADLRYRPVLSLAGGRLVGAEHVPGWPAAAAEPAQAARAFAFGPAAEAGWWISLGVPAGPGPGELVDAVAGLLRASGLAPHRLVLRIGHAELTDAVGTGVAAALGRLGVRLSVSGFATTDWSCTVLRSAPVASVEVSLGGLRGSEAADVAVVRSIVDLCGAYGVAVLGRDVETDGQLALAAEAGVALVEGYWWGSPGSLPKLLGTWARLPVSG